MTPDCWRLRPPALLHCCQVAENPKTGLAADDPFRRSSRCWFSPPPALYFLCWVALAPLIVALVGPSSKALYDGRGRELTFTTVGQGLLLAWVNGIIFYAGTCFWIFHTLHAYGGMSPRSRCC